MGKSSDKIVPKQNVANTQKKENVVIKPNKVSKQLARPYTPIKPPGKKN
jgi:hypothetical protein